MTHDIIDIHHHGAPAVNAVNAIDANDVATLCDGYLYSVGIHPWSTCGKTVFDIDTLAGLCNSPKVVAIGETGIDRIKGASAEIQTELFKTHALLAETVGKPLIIHSVKSTDMMLQLRKQLRPAMPWIIHGFRGNPATAMQLVRAGFHLSVGLHFNSDAVKSIPQEKLLAETDESTAPITQIIESIAAARNTGCNEMMDIIKSNCMRVISACQANS